MVAKVISGRKKKKEKKKKEKKKKQKKKQKKDTRIVPSSLSFHIFRDEP